MVAMLTDTLLLNVQRDKRRCVRRPFIYANRVYIKQTRGVTEAAEVIFQGETVTSCTNTPGAPLCLSEGTP